MSRTVRVLVGVVLGFVAVVLIDWLVLGDDSSPGPVVSEGRPVESSFPAIDHDPAAASDLLESWQAWREGTFIVDGTWTRTLDSGGPPLSGTVHIVQSPPNRVVERLGSIVELFDGSIAACEAGPADEVPLPECVAGESGLSYQQRVDSELGLVRSYVDGDGRIYDVGRGLIPGCYRAELEVATLGSPWGRWAEFCFDSETGALLSSRIRRQSAVDVEVDVVTSAVVTEADFPAN